MSKNESNNKKPMGVGGVQEYGTSTGKPESTGSLKSTGSDLRSGGKK